ncbi:MAG: glycosyltransferase [Minisyncoccia bacterium]
MRILYVITKANWGGAQRYVYDLATAAQAGGHEVAVAYGEPGGLAEKLTAVGIRTIALPKTRNHASLGALCAASRDLYSLFTAERPDVVHLNSSLAATAGAYAARRAGIARIIFTAHGWAFNESRPAWQRVVLRVFAWFTVLFSNETICVSNAIAQDIAWMPLVRAKLVVIRHGIVCAPLVPREIARNSLLPGHEESFWIGMLSELHPTKRVEDAIEAFAKIAKDAPCAILVILGEGERRPELEALAAARGLESRIFLLGFVADAPAKLLAFDLFLHTSQSEALGYAILEAGCAALPVVATAVGGVPEIIASGTCGILVPPRKPSAIAGALLRCIEDKDASTSFGSALRARVVTAFPLDRMLAATLARYA